MKLIKFLFIAITLANVNVLIAQDGGVKDGIKDKIEAQRIAFITKELDLTPEESKKFWPLYNEYRKNEISIRKSSGMHKLDPDNMTESEANEAIKMDIDKEERLLQNRKMFVQKFKEIIPARKIVKLNQTERMFKEQILDQIRERRPMRGQR